VSSPTTSTILCWATSIKSSTSSFDESLCTGIRDGYSGIKDGKPNASSKFSSMVPSDTGVSRNSSDSIPIPIISPGIWKICLDLLIYYLF
jgi:hypothetical protein